MTACVLYTTLGFTLGMLGVVCGAFADRIRYGKATQRKPPREREREATTPPPGAASPQDPDAVRLGEVVVALVRSGFTKDQACSAACAVAATDRHTTENWLRAALRACRPIKGAAS